MIWILGYLFLPERNLNVRNFFFWSLQKKLVEMVSMFIVSGWWNYGIPDMLTCTNDALRHVFAITFMSIWGTGVYDQSLFSILYQKWALVTFLTEKNRKKEREGRGRPV